MHTLKPTIAKLALTVLLVVLLVPFLQLSQPGCAEFAKLPHGDGAPTVCLEGIRTLVSYGIQLTGNGLDLSHYGSWNWPLEVEPNLVILSLGSIIAYIGACFAIFYINKIKHSNPQPSSNASMSSPDGEKKNKP